ILPIPVIGGLLGGVAKLLVYMDKEPLERRNTNFNNGNTGISDVGRKNQILLIFVTKQREK
ncbi:hypothetical protein EBR78_05055, partial [bacterium]|nr:hypothetical protein [bacterium]